MDIIFLLLPISVTFALIALLSYIWAVKKGQYDDLKTPAIRVLLDEEEEKDSKDK